MITIQKEFFINRPPAEVFAYVTHIPNNAEWQKDVLSAEILSEGPVGVGTKASLTRRAMGKELKSEILVTVCEPGRQFTARTTSGPVATEVTNKMSELAGGTQMSIVAKVEAGGL
jgi:hypothetical protein